MSTVTIQGGEEKKYFAQRFALWIAIGSMVMMFAGFTSAYIVKKGDAINWTVFPIPTIFYLSTALILLSSVTMWLAHRSFRKDQLKAYKGYVGLTLIAGIAFVVCQVLGWQALVDQGILLTEEISGSFFYVLTGVHAAHVVGGLLLLLISFLHIRKKLKDPVYELTAPVSPKRKVRVELVATYWHFVDVLWIYLFFFILFNHS